MSGIAGIWHRDGRPVAPGDIARMTAAMPHRGPDGVDSWVADGVGLGHCMLRTTPESLQECQPLRDDSRELCLTFDGRIDNRDELRAALGHDRRHLRDDTDAELVLQAYRTWEKGAIVRLIGDFSLALWDGRRRQLVCARDFLGKRPFYYHFNGSSFRFASEPQAVLADASIPRDPNKAMIGEYLTGLVQSTTDTLFKHLFRLPPAHLLVVSDAGLTVDRYWEWDPTFEIRFEDDREYASYFLDVCASAVEVRLRSPGPMMLELSGGVDSSSLVGLIEHLRRSGRYDGRLEAYSLVFPGRACDETGYIRAVVSMSGLVTHEITPKPAGAAAYEAQAHLYLDLPDYPMTMMRREPYLAAAARGARVVLTGKGPDEWLGGSPYVYADALRHFRLRRFATELRAGVEGVGPRSALSEVWSYGARPLVPPPLRRLVRALRPDYWPPPWIRASFSEEIDLAGRIQARRPRGLSFARCELAANLDGGFQAHANEFAERGMSAHGLEGRDPFDDRRVVEASLALPDDQRWRNHLTKHVLREAVSGLIPEVNRSRSDKADYSHVFCEEFLHQGGSALFRDLALEDMGWIDGARVRAMYHELEDIYRAGDPGYQTNMWSIWMLLSVERWLGANV